MPRTRRTAIDDGTSGQNWLDARHDAQFASYPGKSWVSFDLSQLLQLELGGAASPAGDVGTFVLWNIGIVSFGDPTQAQIDFVASGASPFADPGNGNAGFPGEFIAITWTGAVYDAFEYASGWVDYEKPYGYGPDEVTAFFEVGGAQLIIAPTGFTILDTPNGATAGYQVGGASWQENGRDAYLFEDVYGDWLKQQGGPGSDTLEGTGFDDLLIGGGGADSLTGGPGNDVFEFRAVADSSVANGSVDTISDFASGYDSIRIPGLYVQSFGVEFVGGVYVLTAVTPGGTLKIESLAPLTGDDVVADMRIGGTAGADALTGLRGNDQIAGGTGADTLTGGDGDDVFLYHAVADSSVATGIDRIVDLYHYSFEKGGYEADRVVVPGITAQGLYWASLADPLDAGKSVQRLTIETATGDLVIDIAGSLLRRDSIVVDLDMDGSGAADTLEGAGGTDRIGGGSGADVIWGWGGEDALVGGAGNDTIEGDGSEPWIGDFDGADTIDGGTGDDSLQGGGGDDLIEGGEGRDTLEGAGGADTLQGGTQGDRIEDGDSQDDLLSGGPGDDTLRSSFGDDTLLGGGGNDSIGGAPWWFYAQRYLDHGDSIDGGPGNDTIFADVEDDTILGGAGNDYIDGNAGNDLALGGDGHDRIHDSEYGYFLFSNDTFYGGAGNDTLAAGHGLDLLDGQAGNDSITSTSDFGLDDASHGPDTVVGGDGIDTLALHRGDDVAGVVFSIDDNLLGTVLLADGTLITGFERVELLGSDGAADSVAGGALGDRLSGQAGDDVLLGGGGADSLEGGVGADVLDSGDGDDWITGGDGITGADTIIGGGGYDTLQMHRNEATGGVLFSVAANLAGTVTLPDGTTVSGIERVDLHGSDTAADTLRGGTGDDTIGYAWDGGGDVLDGGGALDLLRADYASYGVGIHFAGQEYGGAVDYAVTGATLTGFERFEVLGTAYADVLNGWNYADSLAGGEGNDLLSGGAGDDTLAGGMWGDDTLAGGAGADEASFRDSYYAVEVSLAIAGAQDTGAGTVTLGSIENLAGGASHDMLTGSAQANRLDGGQGDDTLDGGAGADLLIGGAGDDVYYVDDRGDVVVEVDARAGVPPSGHDLPFDIDTVNTSVSYSLAVGTGAAFVENLVLTGTAVRGTGNALANLLVGNAGANVLDGGARADTMQGGGGDDEYHVREDGDVVTETDPSTATGGVDTVLSHTEVFTLPDHVERGRIMGADAATLYGNALDNVLYAGPGNNVLAGRAGADTLSYLYGVTGSAGVTVDLAVTAAQQTGGSGKDQVSTIEHLQGSPNDDRLSGNAGANRLSGAAGDDTLDGGDGNDTMTGGAGADVYRVRDAGDIVVEGAGGNPADAPDQVLSYLRDYTLAPNVEEGRILLSGAASLSGNKLDNLLFAGAGDNLLRGLGGIDTVSYFHGAAGDVGVSVDLGRVGAQATGGSGSDTLVGIENLQGSGSGDRLRGNSAANRLEGKSGSDTLLGAGGDDTLSGGGGGDTLVGGGGGDSFLFESTKYAALTDTISDFLPGTDRIVLDRALFSALGPGQVLDAAQFRTGAGALDADDRILFDAANGALYYDADGNGLQSAPLQFAWLTPGLALSAADFGVIG